MSTVEITPPPLPPPPPPPPRPAATPATTPATPARTLDRYALALVQLCKRRENPSLADLKRWMAWRCGLEVEYVHAEGLVDCMLDMFWELNLILDSGRYGLNGMLVDAQDSEQWKFGACQDTKNDYWVNWLRVLVSRLRNTEVKRLPGYTSEPVPMGD